MLDNSDINRFGTYLYSFSSTMYDEFYFNHTVGDFPAYCSKIYRREHPFLIGQTCSLYEINVCCTNRWQNFVTWEILYFYGTAY